MKINNFRGDLTDVLAETKPLSTECSLQTAWALFQLCAGSVECRRSLGALQEHILSLGVHLKLPNSVALAHLTTGRADSSDITVDDLTRWVGGFFGN